MPQGRLTSHDELRDQEVLRAHKELAAYFRGLRTEREARSALKIIKAFIRDRERLEPAKRRPLPTHEGDSRAISAITEEREINGAAITP